MIDSETVLCQVFKDLEISSSQTLSFRFGNEVSYCPDSTLCKIEISASTTPYFNSLDREVSNILDVYKTDVLVGGTGFLFNQFGTPADSLNYIVGHCKIG